MSKATKMLNQIAPKPEKVRTPRAFHPLVRDICQAIAGESYEIMASKLPNFYKRYPKQNDFIRKEWPRFFWGAINAMDGVVRGLRDQAMLAEGKTFHEVLGLKDTYREALEMQASIPMEGTMIEKKGQFR